MSLYLFKPKDNIRFLIYNSIGYNPNSPNTIEFGVDFLTFNIILQNRSCNLSINFKSV